jgi:hypothetical protein
MVYVRTATGSPVLVYEGEVCPARDLANAVASAAGVSVHVRSIGLVPLDISSFWSFTRQLRCGVQEPSHPCDIGQYPSAAWNVLDLPFLVHWTWTWLIVAVQAGLTAVAVVVVVKRWRASTTRAVVMGFRRRTDRSRDRRNGYAGCPQPRQLAAGTGPAVPRVAEPCDPRSEARNPVDDAERCSPTSSEQHRQCSAARGQGVLAVVVRELAASRHDDELR